MSDNVIKLHTFADTIADVQRVEEENRRTKRGGRVKIEVLSESGELLDNYYVKSLRTTDRLVGAVRDVLSENFEVQLED